ncbi:MAG TPA: MATE family efflux transporter [Clostridiales bacterium]|nr:MATE family efflux transporter [Clostridiales bacterium]
MFSKKDLMKLIIPLIIEQVLAVTVGLVDSIMVANVGEAAVSGVSLVDSINILLIGLFGAMSTGGSVVAAHLLGKKEERSACSAGEQLIAAVLILSAIVMVLALVFGKGALVLLYGDVTAEVMDNARVYFLYSAMSYPMLAVYNSCAALFRTMGNSKISMKISVIMNIIHIVLNAIFIFGMGLGVAGAAISTLISRTFAAITLFLLIRNAKLPIHIGRIRAFRPDMAIIKKILHIGIPNGLENSVFQIGKILVQGIIAGLGTSAITANAVAGTLGSFGVLPGSAIALALITVVGQCMGAGDFDGIKFYTKRLIKYAYSFVVVLNILIVLLLPLILKLYGLSDETSALTRQLMIYHAILSSLIWPLSFTLPSALRATYDVKFTMWISLVSMWVWRIAFSYVLAIYFNLGVFGVWIAMTIDWLFRSVCFAVRFKKEKYRSMPAL